MNRVHYSFFYKTERTAKAVSHSGFNEKHRRLGTIISARNNRSLKDAIQSAKDEKLSTASTSGEILGMYKNNNNFKSNYRFQDMVLEDHEKAITTGLYPSEYLVYGNRNRGRNYLLTSRGTSHPLRKRPSRGTVIINKSRGDNRNQGIRRQYNINIMTESETENRQNSVSRSHHENSANCFFRD